MSTTFANIRAECARKGLSIEQFSKYLGIDRSTYYRWERKRCIPSIYLAKMAELFGQSVDTLLGIDKVSAEGEADTTKEELYERN